ncbi:MAG: taurine catabolism dioxygenase TauD [Rhodospirillaceae bacterium]|nr:taurine catabolism dioxygenase TauD [Rhodospirillaceae bacterium]|tara:strand:- start:1480 stop:2328 length:849 start_codon:yes stop_codon:yes gene_type:complete
MQINKLTDSFAAEVVGARISDDMSTADLQTIMDAFIAHQVIVIRGQSMTPVEQKNFSRNFGELVLHISSKNKHEDHPELLILSNKKIDGKWVGATNAGDEWHTDTQYTAKPCKCTMLHALEVPEEGGETGFINTYAAYEALDKKTKDRLVNLRGVNSWNRLRNPRVKVPEQHGDGKSVYDIGHPDVFHPIVRTHPETGRKALYVSPRHTLHVDGMDPEESEDLLQKLFAMQQRPDHIYIHKWQLGDVLIWDNRCTLHKGMGGIKEPGIRHLHRTLMEGTIPV